MAVTYYQAASQDDIYKAYAEAINKQIEEFRKVSNHRISGATGKTFRLICGEDETGVSGTGHVATGHVWPDGSVSLKWHTNGSTLANISHYPGVSNMLSVHGHKSTVWPYAYASKVEYVKDEKPAATQLLKELGNFSYELGDVAERISKGLSSNVEHLKERYGKILDLVQAAT